MEYTPTYTDNERENEHLSVKQILLKLIDEDDIQVGDSIAKIIGDYVELCEYDGLYHPEVECTCDLKILFWCGCVNMECYMTKFIQETEKE